MGRRRRAADGAAADGAAGLPEAIAALSRTLPAGPSPETFRRAKFDRPEAAPALWRLLSRLLCPPPAAGAASAHAPEPDARAVRAALRRRGCPRWARLPEDGSAGSRELLLALAWLLARGPLLEQLLARARVRLGDELPPCQEAPPAARAETDGPVDVRRLQWLAGQLRLRWRALAAGQQELCALLSQIHEFTRGCHSDPSLGHLSAAETELLRDPEGGRQLLRRLESENARLEAFLRWRPREPVFWRWMDSVLGAVDPEASAPTPLPGPPQRGADPLDLLSRELQALQEELQAAVRRRRAAWAAGAAARAPEDESWRLDARAAVDRELAELQRACEQDGAPDGCPRPCRLVRSPAPAPGAPGLHAAQAIGALRSQEARLEAELRRLRGRCRQELARLVGALPGLVWVLPPGS